MTGAMTRVAFADAATAPLGYTLPDGQQILGITQTAPLTRSPGTPRRARSCRPW